MKQHLYVIAANNGLVKVGRSASPWRRVSQLGRPDLGLWLCWASAWPREDAVKLEAATHYALRRHFDIWEWFYVRPEVAVRAARRMIKKADAGLELPCWRPIYNGQLAVPRGGRLGIYHQTT